MSPTRRISVLCLAAALAGCGFAVGPAPVPSMLPVDQQAFWLRLTGLCGQAFEGRMTEGTSPGDSVFKQNRLVMHVRDCGADTVRIPFVIGPDASRTWIVTRVNGGLRLKHDHRHEDGTEDQVSRYGGDTRVPGSAKRQEFPADSFTAQLLPVAATNVWALEVDPGRTFAYELTRRGTDRRFRVEFDLARPVAPPAR
ncbi:MAG TPA: hypothetical protein VFR81_12290 [Longimicrobium sp.]|nr:hypothetical protein [Longimicrobium sp.]